jgi:protoporphyrinogen/coproporphyrinogen III oxidase
MGEHPTRAYNRIIATVPAPELATMIQSGAGGHRNPPRHTVMSLTEHNYAVSVMVVNLYYSQPDLIPFRGFGYLIPRSIPYQQNPERALGVIFGSDSTIGQDTVPGTKFTVMLGGHWWDNWLESDYPDHDEATLMARSLLGRHLGIKATPVAAKSQLQRNAIPQYTVGHLSRMEEISRAVREEFNHRLTLAGSWYGGIGVNDCIRQAYLAASYGTGAHRLDDVHKILPRVKPDYRDWDMEGGLVTSPQRWFLGSPADIKYFNG